MSTQNVISMIHKSLAKSVTIMLVLVLLLSIVTPAIAKENEVAAEKNKSIASSLQHGPTDPAELETFLDGLLAKEMQENHIAGAAVSVVKDGKLFFAKGYGYADLEKGIPVDPEQTVFRVGSVGKTFTWTAVMQLVDQGKLDLDADINTYLDFRIPDTYPQPITLKHLMTHTSGFDERWAGSVVSDAKDVMPVREWLVSHMAARVRPPGDSAAYSNYNAMMAGYIVERVSGLPYDQYIQEHIFNPLGMAHSSAQEPMPPDLRPYASVGYAYFDGDFQVFPDLTAQTALVPSGMHLSTVTDMARFMIAHLQNGRYSDANIPEVRIFKEATAQQMHNIHYTPDPRLLGIAYGFFDHSLNGQHTIGHRGFAGVMNSLLLLLPDHNLGVFVVYNSAGGGTVVDPHTGFQKAFFDHYYPAPAVEPLQPPADFAERAGRFVGSYRRTAFPSGSFMKLSGLFGSMAAEISDSGDGALLLTWDYSFLSRREWRFVEMEPLYFHQVDGPLAIVFREDDRGRITHMFLDPINFTSFEKLDWYETPGFNMALLLFCVLVFLSMLPVAAIRFIRNRRPSDNGSPASRGARAAYWIIVGISILNLLAVAGIAWGTMLYMSNVMIDPPLIMKIALELGILSAMLTVGALVYTALAWKKGYWSLASRAYYTLVTVAAVAFVWFLNYWNLLGLRY
jgi:CubicO group peptidase (beta-lactamase class C family)